MYTDGVIGICEKSGLDLWVCWKKKKDVLAEYLDIPENLPAITKKLKFPEIKKRAWDNLGEKHFRVPWDSWASNFK